MHPALAPHPQPQSPALVRNREEIPAHRRAEGSRHGRGGHSVFIARVQGDFEGRRPNPANVSGVAAHVAVLVDGHRRPLRRLSQNKRQTQRFGAAA